MTASPRPRGTQRFGAMSMAAVPFAIAVLTAASVPALSLAVQAATPSPTQSAAEASGSAPDPTPSALVSGSPSGGPTSVSPAASTHASPAPNASPTPSLSSALPSTAGAAPLTTGGLRGAGVVLASIPSAGAAPHYLQPGRPLAGAQPFDDFRLGVLVVNPSAAAVSWTPRLEFRPAGAADFQPVPQDATPGLPFHAATEWVAVQDGTVEGPVGAAIDPASAHLAAPVGVQLAAGRRSSGTNPDVARAIAPSSASEQEFSVGISIDATFGATYELRVTDAGTAVPDLATAQVVLGAEPPLLLSPGQQAGSAVDGAAATPELTGGVRYPLRTAAARAMVAAGAEYPLIATEALLDPVPLMLDPTQTYTVGPNGPGTIHQPGGSTTTAQCSTCHSTHTAQSPALIRASSATDQCYVCHGAEGLGGPMDVQAQFATDKANDPATRTYYSHDLGASGHVLDSKNEFQGTPNRHSQCADCHNPHNLTSTPDTYDGTTSTWTVSGSYGGVVGVGVTNGAAGKAPTYTLLEGSLNKVTSEYQLCFKCHSGFTTLPVNDPAKPSRDLTDLAVAFNPANPSFHPVELAGKNQTAKMADSLSGTSQYKIWNLATTDTIRCVMCHSGDSVTNTTAKDANLPVHASANRGILTRPYEDRVLSSAGQFYDPAGFALCLTCHAETPFANRSGDGSKTATNFAFHGLHTSAISGKGSGGTDIDTAGDGQGNARCAECHFRSHSTTDVVPGQALSGERLVNFSPNVLPSKAMGGKPTFTKTVGGGTCTLTCHGKDHQEMRYVS